MPVHISGGLFGIGSQNTILANAPYRGKGTTVDPAMTPEQVPYAARNRITESLGHAWGRAPTEQEVVDQYEREVLYSAGLRPEMAYRDIPKDIRRQLEDKYPKASEQQRIDYYLRMMIEATK